MNALGLGSLEDLALFVSVARDASFVATSRRTRVSTSSVSRAVARLEDALGARLLQRTSRKVVVTEEGRQLLALTGPLVDEMAGALREVSDQRAEPQGRIRVTAPLFTGASRISSALASFAVAHPRVTVELDLSNATRDLLEEGFDLAFRAGPLKTEDFIARRLWAVPFGLFASKAFVAKSLGGRQRLSEDELRRVPAITTRATWRFRRADGQLHEVKPSARFSVNDPRASIDIARAGLGVICVPLEAMPVGEAELVALKADVGEPESRDLYAVYPTRKLLPTRVRLALEWVARNGPGLPVTEGKQASPKRGRVKQ
jgi:LysR family transcriptional regulator, transcriptional activator AphB